MDFLPLPFGLRFLPGEEYGLAEIFPNGTGGDVRIQDIKLSKGAS